MGYLHEKQDALRTAFRLNDHERYDWDQDSGQLVFSSGGVPAVIATFQFVGSLSTRTHTWLWSWANDSDIESVKSQARQVRAHGEEHRFLKLACAYWTADEFDAWEMTAVAAYLLKAKGAYRSPSDHLLSFMIMTDVRWAQ
jgi:2,4-dienoyl-CoA reductase-like NADH-dependent reductase (Old Yellow Enzyme family)